MSTVNAETVLTALDNLQTSYLVNKKEMNATLTNIKKSIHTIEKCTETLLKNYSDKEQLQEKIDQLVEDSKKTKELKEESDKIKQINEKVKSLKNEIETKESENKKLLEEIQYSTDYMKSICVENKKITGLKRRNEEKEYHSDEEENKSDDLDLDGGYKHSSRKSRSKSTRRRVKNKFKKIKIFSKKRGLKKKKKRK